MIWNKITIDTTTEAADIVASVLFDNNIVGAEIEDNQNLSDEDLSKMYVDIPKINVDDGKSKVSFYVSIGNKVNAKEVNIDKSLIDNSYMPSSDNIFTKEEFDKILDSIKIELEDYRNFVDMGSLKISEIELDDNEFMKKWKENFKPISIGNINILPNWENINDRSKLNILIEPGNAFGTGQHATTKLCLDAIQKIMKENKIDTLLDLGSGSGILSIASRKLGVKSVVAIDIDDSVEFNLKENLKLNNISKIKKIFIDDNSIDIKSFEFIYGFGNVLTDENIKKEISKIKYDIIVINILAPVIITFIKEAQINDLISDGGYLVLSGIIKEMEKVVVDTIKRSGNVEIIETNYENDWVSIVCKKNQEQNYGK